MNVELADQYKIMDAVSDVPRRNLLARHLREVVDILELKVSSIACSPVGAANTFPDVFFVAIRATKSHPSTTSSSLKIGLTLNRLFRITPPRMLRHQTRWVDMRRGAVGILEVFLKIGYPSLPSFTFHPL